MVGIHPPEVSPAESRVGRSVRNYCMDRNQSAVLQRFRLNGENPEAILSPTQDRESEDIRPEATHFADPGCSSIRAFQKASSIIFALTLLIHPVLANSIVH